MISVYNYQGYIFQKERCHLLKALNNRYELPGVTKEEMDMLCSNDIPKKSNKRLKALSAIIIISILIAIIIIRSI